MVNTGDRPSKSMDEIRTYLLEEFEATRRSLREVTLKIEQGQNELNNHSQRNSSNAATLQQLKIQGAYKPFEEVRSTYESVLEEQKRLFVIRGQLEKLKTDQIHFQRLQSILENILPITEKSSKQTDFSSSKATSSIESIIQAQEAERQRLSRQMHDGPAQALSNFILQAEIAMRLLDVSSPQAREEINNLRTSAFNTFQKVRNFIFELRPMMLDDLGLVPTIKRYVETFKQQSGKEVTFIFSGQERRMESYLEVMIFRALQELIGNAARHGNANSIKVHLDFGDTMVKVSVEDDGKGFKPEVLNQGNNLGLKLIRDRVEIVGGAFEIDSKIGNGTRVQISIPSKV